MVVSRPVKDTCSLTPTGALLVSSTDPGIKLQFPPASTVQTRTITLQVAPQYVAVCVGSSRTCRWLVRRFVPLSVGAAVLCLRGPDAVWWSSGQHQPPPLPLPDPQHTFPAAYQSSGPSATWGHRYNMHLFFILMHACIMWGHLRFCSPLIQRVMVQHWNSGQPKCPQILAFNSKGAGCILLHLVPLACIRIAELQL